MVYIRPYIFGEILKNSKNLPAIKFDVLLHENSILKWIVTIEI